MGTMKTMIDLDDDALVAAAHELGTSTKRDTVNAALRLAASRRSRLSALIEGGNPFGVGEDIDDAEIMASARR
jgi:Arc/MetJ family transcription regulator